MKRATPYYCACGCGKRVVAPTMPPRAQKLRLARVRREMVARLHGHLAAVAAAHAQQADRVPGDERPDQPAHAAPTMH